MVREANGVEGDLPVQLVDEGASDNSPEEEEGGGGEKFAFVLGEVGDAFALFSCDVTECQPGDEGGDEPVAFQELGGGEGGGSDGQRCQPSVEAFDVVGHRSSVEDPSSGQSDDDTAEEPEPDLANDELAPHAVARWLAFGGGDAEQHGDDGHHNPVVEAALGVETLSDADREPLVADHGLAERSIGWGQHGGDERGLGPGQLIEQQNGDDGAEDDRER